MSAPEDFAAFILTNRRPDRVITYDSLRAAGYTGPVYLLVDDLDPTRAEYLARFGEQVVIFDKAAIAKTFDQADNFNDMRAIIYARNASFEVAKQLGIRRFIQLDDDYTHFSWRFGQDLSYRFAMIRNLDAVFARLLTFFEESGVHSLAVAQGGDYVGGEDGSNDNAKHVRALRKCMNTFICSTDRPFQFVGRINEDVNTYTHVASKGFLFLTTNQVSIQQKQTQTNKGGMTEMYLDSGTYLKSFYTVMMQPSSVTVRFSQAMGGRLHHQVIWRNTVPKILSETLRKPSPAP